MKLERFNTLNEADSQGMVEAAADDIFKSIDFKSIDIKSFEAAEDKEKFVYDLIDERSGKTDGSDADFTDKFKGDVTKMVISMVGKTNEEQRYYGNSIKKDTAVTKNAGSAKIKKFADLEKENKAEDNKKTKPGVQKYVQKDQVVKGPKVNEDESESDIITFKRWKCVLQFGKYSNDRTAIELVHYKTGEPVAVATVNIPQAKLADDEIIIKDWSENNTMVDTLVKAGVISEPVRTIPTGHVEAHVCKLLVQPK